MIRYNLEYWEKQYNIQDGIHKMYGTNQETVQEFILRCYPFETCDYCGQKIRVDLGKNGIGSEIDCGDWKCAEYSCDSWICDECITKISMIVCGEQRK